MDCKYCHSEQVVKRGGYGKEGHRFKCRTCKKTFTVGGVRKTYSFQEKKHIVNLSKGYSNLTRVCRIYGLSKNTVYNRRGEVDKYNTVLQIKLGQY